MDVQSFRFEEWNFCGAVLNLTLISCLVISGICENRYFCWYWICYNFRNWINFLVVLVPDHCWWWITTRWNTEQLVDGTSSYNLTLTVTWYQRWGWWICVEEKITSIKENKISFINRRSGAVNQIYMQKWCSDHKLIVYCFKFEFK